MLFCATGAAKQNRIIKASGRIGATAGIAAALDSKYRWRHVYGDAIFGLMACAAFTAFCQRFWAPQPTAFNFREFYRVMATPH